MPKIIYALLLLLCSPGLLASDSTDAPLLLDYQREFSMIAEADNSVDVKVYADGQVNIHYPFFMRRAGDYRYGLSAAELDELLQSLRQLGVDEFDAAAARQSLAQAEQAAYEGARRGNGTVRVVTDPEITHLRMATSLVASVDVSGHAFSFTGVRNQAGIYPQVTAVTELASALDQLDALTTDNRMERIEVTQ